MAPLLQLLALFLLLLIPVFSLFLLRKKKANLPPGPPTLPIIGNLHQLGELPHHSLHKLSQKYGPVMLLQLGKFRTLFVSSAEMAEEVLKTHDLECCSRPTQNQGPQKLSYNYLDVAFCPYNDHWREIRKLCVMELFATKKVKSFRFAREEMMARCFEYISQHSSQNPVNFNELAFHLLYSMICRIACGRTYEGKQFGKYSNHQDAIVEAMGILGSFSGADFFPTFGWIMDVISGLHARQEKCFRQFDEFYQKIIDEHLDPNRVKPEVEDIIDALLRLLNYPSEEAIFHIVKAVLMNVFLGGIDTGAVTIVWGMAELVKSPRVMNKLQAEIRGCVKYKPMVEDSDLENLKYLKMVVKEILRLHPPNPILLPRLTMKHCKIGGYDVYPGTRIHVNVWAIARDPKYWNNPDEFYPERFEDNDADFKGRNFEFLPFGGGRRICPGLAMATNSTEFILANLVYCFDWELPGGVKREDISMEEKLALTLHRKVPLNLVPIKYNWQA